MHSLENRIECKTKKYLNFQHAPKKIYKELFKEEMAERFKAIDCKSIR